MAYGNKRDFPKIDLYDQNGRYIGSTNWSKTLKEAREKAAEKFGEVIACYADK